MSDVARILKRLESEKQTRRPNESQWLRCYDYTYPLRGSGLNENVLDAEQIAKKKADLVDSTGTEAVRTLVSSILAGMTPASSLWFDQDVDQSTEDERRWLHESSETIWRNIHSSNYDSEAYEGVIDSVCAGWFVLYVEEAPQGGYRFELWPLAQCYIAASKAGGPIDIVYRCYRLTAEQALAEFGAAVSDDIRSAAEKEPTRMFDFVHAIEPRQTYAVGARLAKNLPVASYHIEVTKKILLRESGYHEMPCMVPRWHVLPGSQYAIGPVSDAVADMATLNQLRRFELMNADLAIAGMWIAEDDGVLNPRSVKVGPRKVIVANSVDSMKELKSSTDFNVAFMSEDRLQAQIRKVLLADQLQPQDGPAMTATEVHARMNLIRNLLGPIYGRFQSEFLKPLIARCFGLAYRAGVLGQAPDSLIGREIHIKYQSPLARAQRLEEVTAIDQYVGGLLQVAEATQDPTVMDNVDLDAAARFKAEALGVPAQVIPKQDDMQKRRKLRIAAQEQQQQQAQAADLQQAAGEAAIKQSAGAA